MAIKHEDLWMRWRQSRDLSARDELIAAYLWLVRFVAGRLAVGLPPQFEQNDIEGHGCFGLLEAVERYDPSREIRFETFATPWIRGACLEGIRALQWAPSLRKRVIKLEQAQAELESTLGREPTEAELARFLNISPEDVQRRTAEAGCLSVLSLEEALSEDEGEGTTLKERIADTSAPDPSEAPRLTERRELLARVINSLSDQERMVVSLFYYEGLLAKEISDLLGVSQARVSQIHSRAILRLRGKLARLKELMVS